MMGGGALQQLKCPQCGSPLEPKIAASQTIVCPNCNSYIALGGEELALISAAQSKNLPAPPVPIKIGATMKLDNVDYFVMGRVMYRGWDDEDSFKWNEWQLGGSDGRILWLSYDEKGFGIYERMRLRAPFDIRKSSALPLKDGGSVRIKERYNAEILGAEGELTFRAQRGERLYMAEAAQGGKRYSIQQDNEELEVSVGTSYTGKQIALAFGDDAWAKKIDAQENGGLVSAVIGLMCMAFAAVSMVLGFQANDSGELITRQQVSLHASAPTVNVQTEFDQANRPAIVSLRLMGTLPTNTSVDLDVSVLSPNEIETFLFEREFWHETGVDDEGAWDEAQYATSGMFMPTVTGTHQVRLTLSNPTTANTIPVEVYIRRNHTWPFWYGVYTVIIGGVGSLLLIIGLSATSKAVK